MKTDIAFPGSIGVGVVMIFLLLLSGSKESFAAEIGVEAENADSLVPAMAVFEDENASNGQFITAGLADGVLQPGYAEYQLVIPQAGEYTVWGRVLSPDGATDSFHLTVDEVKNPQNNDTKVWDTGSPIVEWGWSKVKWREQDPLTFELTRGKHTLRVWSREGNTRLDALYLSTDAGATPKLPPDIEPFAVDAMGKLATTWAALKRERK